jgi:prefoldin subunit 4
MMGSGSTVMLRLGDALFESSEEDATEFCEAEVERHQATLDKLEKEEGRILERQGALKKVLYGRFGKSINLEEK